MRQFVNAPNLMTTASLAAGVAALMLAGDGRMGLALAAIGVAALLDSFDGYVARRVGVSGPFGSHLDSLADLVPFGVAPAVMLHEAQLDSVLGAGACIVFVVAGAWRLARFQLIEDEEHFIGLPIPPAGLVLAGAATVALPALPAATLCLLASVAMVSTFTLPTLAELCRLAGRAPAWVREDHGPVRVPVAHRARSRRSRARRERRLRERERARA